MPFRALLLALTLAACGDPSVIDIQAAACERLEACDADGFAATYGDVTACVDAYDDSTSVCYDLHCTYNPAAGKTCQDLIGSQDCADVAAGVQIPECEVDAVFRDCDQVAVDDCLAQLGETI